MCTKYSGFFQSCNLSDGNSMKILMLLSITFIVWSPSLFADDESPIFPQGALPFPFTLFFKYMLAFPLQISLEFLLVLFLFPSLFIFHLERWKFLSFNFYYEIRSVARLKTHQRLSKQKTAEQSRSTTFIIFRGLSFFTHFRVRLWELICSFREFFRNFSVLTLRFFFSSRIFSPRISIAPPFNCRFHLPLIFSPCFIFPMYRCGALFFCSPYWNSFT